MNKQLVSVIIPTYKRPNFLKRSIDSVLAQTYKNIEIIVVDDNNPNTQARMETEQVMKNYVRTNIKYIQHAKNRNGSAARNTGIRNSSGKYIALLDNDDEFMKEKIELQVKTLEELGDSYGVVYTKFIRKNRGKLVDKGVENRSGDLTLEILKGTFYISSGSNILIRRDIVDKINGFDESFLRRQDLEFLIKASLLTKIAHVDKVCLIINKDDRSNAVSLSVNQAKENAERYLEVFNDYIEELPKEKKEKVRISQELLALRKYIIKGRFLTIKKIADKENIKYFTILKYLAYLVKRKVLKQCYGFTF